MSNIAQRQVVLEGGAAVHGEHARCRRSLPVSCPTHVSYIAPVRQPAGRAPQLAVPAPQPAELAGAGAQLCWEGREGGGGPRGARRPARERGREGQGAAFARGDTTARVQVGGWSNVHLGFGRSGGDRLGGDAAAGEGAAAASNRRRRGTIIAARQALAWPRWHCRQAWASCHEIQLWHASKQQWIADGGRLGGREQGRAAWWRPWTAVSHRLYLMPTVQDYTMQTSLSASGATQKSACALQRVWSVRTCKAIN
jgi:hypothetical protein